MALKVVLPSHMQVQQTSVNQAPELPLENMSKRKAKEGASVAAQQNKDPLFFLEGAWEAARKYEDRVLMAECNKILNGQRDRTAYIFRKLDRSGDGSLSRWEFMKGLQALHIPLQGERLRKFVDIFDQASACSMDLSVCCF
jgi:hypothetical protein